jgi:hypothetical protein
VAASRSRADWQIKIQRRALEEAIEIILRCRRLILLLLDLLLTLSEARAATRRAAINERSAKLFHWPFLLRRCEQSAAHRLGCELGLIWGREVAILDIPGRAGLNSKPQGLNGFLLVPARLLAGPWRLSTVCPAPLVGILCFFIRVLGLFLILALVRLILHVRSSALVVVDGGCFCGGRRRLCSPNRHSLAASAGRGFGQGTAALLAVPRGTLLLAVGAARRWLPIPSVLWTHSLALMQPEATRVAEQELGPSLVLGSHP